MANERDYIEKRVVLRNQTTGRFAGILKRKVAAGEPPLFTDEELAQTTSFKPRFPVRRRRRDQQVDTSNEWWQQD